MAESEVDTTRTVVRTYVPAYQREEWDEHAEELDMSRSEFVRSMVQAGRRGFEEADQPPTSTEASSDKSQTEPANSKDTEPPGNTASADLESTVVEVLSTDEYLSWDELLTAVTTDIEDRLEAALQDLQAADTVRYSGRNGGYTLEK